MGLLGIVEVLIECGLHFLSIKSSHLIKNLKLVKKKMPELAFYTVGYLEDSKCSYKMQKEKVGTREEKKLSNFFKTVTLK